MTIFIPFAYPEVQCLSCHPFLLLFSPPTKTVLPEHVFERNQREIRVKNRRFGTTIPAEQSHKRMFFTAISLIFSRHSRGQAKRGDWLHIFLLPHIRSFPRNLSNFTNVSLSKWPTIIYYQVPIIEKLSVQSLEYLPLYWSKVCVCVSCSYGRHRYFPCWEVQCLSCHPFLLLFSPPTKTVLPEHVFERNQREIRVKNRRFGTTIPAEQSHKRMFFTAISLIFSRHSRGQAKRGDWLHIFLLPHIRSFPRNLSNFTNVSLSSDLVFPPPPPPVPSNFSKWFWHTFHFPFRPLYLICGQIRSGEKIW